ncbi:MAG: DUF2802 domain-containing protein [Thauera sp.]|jgi:uncharacterized coiled-coil protein SlyX|nr:DUF2802 domain-containing protein [Thauera sp.]
MSVRSLLWLAALVLALLTLWQGWRAWQLARRPAAVRRPAGRSPARTAADEAADIDEDEDEDEEAEEAEFDYGLSLRTPPAARTAPSAVSAAAATVTPDGELFAAQLELRRLQRELEAEQQQVTEQRKEIERLQSELALLQQTLEEGRGQMPAPAQDPVSPEYAEPLRLAEMGFKDEEISARCGISLAEARLVLAMAQRGGRG